MLVDLVEIAAGRVGLPDLEQRVPYRPAVVVEDATGDDDPLAERFAGVPGREIRVARRRPCPRRRPARRARGAPRAASAAPARARARRWSGSRDRGRADRPRSRLAQSSCRPRVRAAPSARPRSVPASRSDRRPRGAPSPSPRAPARRRRRGGPRSASARARSPRGSRTPRSVTTVETEPPALVRKSSSETNVRRLWRSITNTSFAEVAISGAPPAPGSRTGARRTGR